MKEKEDLGLETPKEITTGERDLEEGESELDGP